MTVYLTVGVDRIFVHPPDSPVPVQSLRPDWHFSWTGEPYRDEDGFRRVIILCFDLCACPNDLPPLPLPDDARVLHAWVELWSMEQCVLVTSKHAPKAAPHAHARRTVPAFKDDGSFDSWLCWDWDGRREEDDNGR